MIMQFLQQLWKRLRGSMGLLDSLVEPRLQPPRVAPSSLVGGLVALERRILFDGAAVATGAEVLVDQVPLPEGDGPLESANPPAPLADNDRNLTATWHALTSEPLGQERREIVFHRYQRRRLSDAHREHGSSCRGRVARFHTRRH